MPRSIKELLVNSPIASLETRIILKHILGISSAKLISHDGELINDDDLMIINNAISQYQQGVPVAYILGYKEFYSRDFMVNQATLIPRSETEHLVDIILSKIATKSKILDMGTGSGCIAITLKLENNDYQIDAVDISEDAIAVALSNATKLCANINIWQSDWFSTVEQKYDIIVSNPPYIEKNDQHLAALKYEPLNALTDGLDGLSHYRQIIEEAPQYLIDGGWIFFEHGYNQGTDIRLLLSQYGYRNIETIRDYSQNERITYAQK